MMLVFGINVVKLLDYIDRDLKRMRGRDRQIQIDTNKEKERD